MWSPILGEEYSIRKQITQDYMWKIKDEISGQFGELHSQEIRDWYTVASIVRIMKYMKHKWAVSVERMRDTKGAHRIFVGEFPVYRQLEWQEDDGRIT
jgi:hypothetical protein